MNTKLPIEIQRALLVLLLISSALAHAVDANYEMAPVKYSKSEPADPVSKLIADLKSGKTKISFDQKFGYLPAFLKSLNIPTSSQMLVFSKTSLQKHFIAPESPRAIYYNDDVYVGYCNHGEVLEVASTDPQLGAIFYTVLQKDTGAPTITRQTHSCLQCHDSSSLTLGVPGHIMRSVYTDLDGMPIYNAGTHHTTQDSPINERWGGWYVSGTHGAQKHMGNTAIKNKDDAEHADFSKGQNVTDLSKFFENSNYLTPHSDIVALMVAEHQTTMHNLMARAGIEMRIALLQERDLNKALGEKPDRRSSSTTSRLKSVCDPLLKYMFFTEEPKLAEPIKGASSFAQEFASRGPKDSRGRSLRDLNLKTRLFKYPCSYLIYSEEYDHLPDIVRDYIVERMSALFEMKTPVPEFETLTPEDREAIQQILSETWKHAPATWKTITKN